jgi:hypothetical protein
LKNLWTVGKYAQYSDTKIVRALNLNDQNLGKTVLYKGDINDVQITSSGADQVIEYKKIPISGLDMNKAEIHAGNYWLISLPKIDNLNIDININVLLQNNLKLNSRGLVTDGFFKADGTDKTFLRYKVTSHIAESVDFSIFVE